MQQVTGKAVNSNIAILRLFSFWHKDEKLLWSEMWRERAFLSEKVSMFQDLDIPEGPYRVHRIRNCL